MLTKGTVRLLNTDHHLVDTKRWRASACSNERSVCALGLFVQRPSTRSVMRLTCKGIFQTIVCLNRERSLRTYSALSLKFQKLGYKATYSLIRSFIIQHDSHLYTFLRHNVCAGLIGLCRMIKQFAGLCARLSNRGPGTGLLAFSSVTDHDSLSLFKQNINPQIGGIA